MTRRKAVKETTPEQSPAEQPLAVVIPPTMIIDQAKLAAKACKEIVLNTAVLIKGKKHVCVEGWEAIAIAHGCFAGAGDAKRAIDEHGNHIGYTAMGYVRNGAGVILSTGEGFVGFDEVDRQGHSTWGSRAEYAGRAMAQTRGISRACRSCFAHIVVFIDKDLDVTPAEEMGHEPNAPGHASEPVKETAAPKRHSRTRAYEEEKNNDSKTVKDLADLEKWMGEMEIPEGFVLAMLKERKLVAPNLTLLANAPPGVIRRVLASRERLALAYNASDASGAGTKSTEKAPAGKPVDGEGNPEL